MAYNHQCSHRHCRKRITLARPIEQYIREPKCPACGRKQLKFDPAPRRQTMQRTCRCGGVHFPHRIGTVLSVNEFCERVSMDAVSTILLRHDGIEPDGPADYVGHHFE